MNKIKVGIIGTGGISVFHAKGYLRDERCEIYAVCDKNENRVKGFAEKHNVQNIFTDHREMLKLKELDAVSVCTWNNSHAPISIAALKAGKNVLCEKPMAINANEAMEMEKVSKETGKILMVGFVRRFGNDTKILKDFIDDGFFGDIYYTKASYLRRNGFPGGWFGDIKLSGGGPLIDLGVHVIDLVIYLCGKPKAISVTGTTFNKLGDGKEIKGTKEYTSVDDNGIFNVEDMASAMIKFDNGMVLNVETSFSLNIKKDCGSIELFGTKAGAKLDPDLELYSRQSGYLVDVIPALETRLSFEGLFESEIEHFVDCVHNRCKCLSPAEDGVELMKIIDAVYRSSKKGKEVIL